jgi:hypothetical protein
VTLGPFYRAAEVGKVAHEIARSPSWVAPPVYAEMDHFRVTAITRSEVSPQRRVESAHLAPMAWLIFAGCWLNTALHRID